MAKPKPNIKAASIVRVIFLLILFLAAGWWSYRKIEGVSANYPKVATVTTEQKELNASFKSAAAELSKQRELFQGWSVLILGGIVAIITTTKVHRTPNVSLAFIPLAPAVAFLLNSLNAGWEFTRRYSFLVSRDNFLDLNSLSALVLIQSDFFLYAILCVSLVAGWFLFLIVWGKIEPFEEKKEG